MAEKIKAMTFNIRVNVDKGANDFDLRRVRIAEFIKAEQPHIIGFQEATDYMRKCMAESLEGYTVLGCGREKNYRGESVAIAYRTDEFQVIEIKNFWLSNTPSVPGSRYGGDQSGCPRITTALKLKHNSDTEPFWFINTHLDHQGKQARVLGSTQLLQFAHSCGSRCIITGDFNAVPDDGCIKVIVDNGFCDATANVLGSFHAFCDKTEEEMEKIDFIFTDMTPSKKAVLHEDKPREGTFMSDHRPISVEIEL